jgi:hypothetical protein
MATAVNIESRRLDDSAHRFDHPDVVETSVGPLYLRFVNGAGQAPMINVFDLHHLQPDDFPSALIPKEPPKTKVWMTFKFTDSGWRSECETIRVDGEEKPMPALLRKELAGHVARWALTNQDRYAEYQRGEWLGDLAACGEMLGEQAETLLDSGDIDELIKCSWANLVDPAVVALARQAADAVARVHRAIAEAQEVFGAIAQANPYEN